MEGGDRFCWRRRLHSAKLGEFAMKGGQEPREFVTGTLRGRGKRLVGRGTLRFWRRGQRVLKGKVEMAIDSWEVSEAWWSIDIRVWRRMGRLASLQFKLAVRMAEKEARAMRFLDGRRSGVRQCRRASFGDLRF